MNRPRRWIRWGTLTLVTVICCLGLSVTSCSLSAPRTTAEYPSTDIEAVEYFTQLGLLQGELQVVKELTQLGHLDRLADHLGVTVNQPYATLNRRVDWQPDYLISLFNLRDLISVKSFARKELLLEQQQRVVDSLNAASISSAVRRWQSVPLTLRATEQHLLQFGRLYKESIANQVIVNQTKYESARGLIAFLKDNVFQSIKADLSRINPVLVGRMDSSLTSLASAVPTAVLSGTSVSDVGAIDRAVADFVEASQRLIGVT
ncbi:hypothetical protein ACQ4M3_13305 [Leptolyngbya sp. AN03gr2]|uniref:hypothetical protein n=1 Tax=unclassified Leptolyngbya TaxID=2650499 RepID=UPI003D31B1D3